MAIELDLVNASGTGEVPGREDFLRWVGVALGEIEVAELGIRLVTAEESAELNLKYREKPGATNVLAFPADLPEELGLDLLGDLVICSDLVRQEAKEQGKPEQAHWAHLVIHGVLHLLGFDHLDEIEARVMESRETELLASIGISDPYH